VGALIAVAGAILLFLAALWFAARRDITVCILRVDNGEIDVVGGTIAPRVLSDLRDVVRRPRVTSATVRVLRAKDHATVEASGKLTSDQVQQLRNIIGSIPIAKLANGKAKAKRSPSRG
jgi:hypothetical protein